MLKRYLEVGQIVGTHGVRGEMRVQPWCDSPGFLGQFKVLYFDADAQQGKRVLSCRPHGNVALLFLEGVESVEEAQALRGRVLFMDRREAKLAPGDYFIQDLIGSRVEDADTGLLYGTLSDVSATGANDVWHITGENGKEHLIPAIPDVVIETDVEAGVVKIRPMKGIFDDAD